MTTPIRPENANTYPTSFVPNGSPLCENRLSAKSANPEKKVLNANVNAKNCHSIGPSCLSLNDSVSAFQRDSPSSSSGCGCGTTAGNRKYVHRMLVRERPAAANIGYVFPNWARNPEMPGPTRKPSPNAIPMMPNDFVRFSTSVTSAM